MKSRAENAHCRLAIVELNVLLRNISAFSCARYASREIFSPAPSSGGVRPGQRIAFALQHRLQGQEQFNRLVSSARTKSLVHAARLESAPPPVGPGAGRHALPTHIHSWEIDNRIEAPSVNFNGMDCWTFFEISLGFARMLDEPEANWTPGAFAPLCRNSILPRRGLHRRISFPPPLPGRRLASNKMAD